MNGQLKKITKSTIAALLLTAVVLVPSGLAGQYPPAAKTSIVDEQYDGPHRTADFRRRDQSVIHYDSTTSATPEKNGKAK